MRLTEFESQSAMWQRVETEITERLAVFREQNDGQLDEERTARVRGQIAMCKEILAWKPTGTETNIM